MIRHHQAIRRHERPRPTAVESHARQPHVLQPLVAGFKTILVLQRLLRELVVEPHSLIRRGPGRKHRRDRKHNECASRFHVELHEYFRFYLLPFGTTAGFRLNRPEVPTTSSNTNMTPNAVIVVHLASDIPCPNTRSIVGAKFNAFSQSSLKFKNAASTPTSDPPAM